MSDTPAPQTAEILTSIEGKPLTERPAYLASLSVSQREELKTYLNQLTDHSPTEVEAGRHQGERVAMMVNLNELERRAFPGGPEAAAKKGINVLGLAALGAGIAVAAIILTGNIGSDRPATDSAALSLSAQEAAPSPSPYAPSLTPPEPIGVGSGGVSSAGLQSEIEAGRSAIQSLEAQLRDMRSDIDLLDSQLSSYRTDIAHDESNARQGLNVDEYKYRSAVDNYNALVPQYNLQLETYNSRYAEYQRALTRTNQLIVQYNARERR